MRLNDVIALTASMVVRLLLLLVIVSLFFTPLMFSLLFIVLLLLFNQQYKCYGYKGICIKTNRCSYYSESCSLITYNVNLAYKGLNTKENSKKIGEYLLNVNADIVLLQEYNPHLYPELHEKLITLYSYGNPFSSADRYKTVYSKYPITDYTQLCDNCNESIAYGCEQGENKRYLPVCGMHLIGKNCDFYLMNCHLQSNNLSPLMRDFKLKKLNKYQFIREARREIIKGYNIRRKQMGRIITHLHSQRVPILICGDLNEVCGSTVTELIEKNGYEDAWWERGVGFGYTIKAFYLKWRLDHVYTNKLILIDKIQVDNIQFSDHKPVLCEFRIKKLDI